MGTQASVAFDCAGVYRRPAAVLALFKSTPADICRPLSSGPRARGSGRDDSDDVPAKDVGGRESLDARFNRLLHARFSIQPLDSSVVRDLHNSLRKVCSESDIEKAKWKSISKNEWAKTLALFVKSPGGGAYAWSQRLVMHANRMAE